MPLLHLPDVRARAAQALAPAGPDDPTVHDNVVDSVDPPALILGWDDPWLEPQALNGRCLWDARFQVLCIAGRLEPGPGVEKLEQLVAYVVERMHADAYTWPTASVQAPRVFTIANVQLLGARVGYRVPVTV